MTHTNVDVKLKAGGTAGGRINIVLCIYSSEMKDLYEGRQTYPEKEKIVPVITKSS
jgi:hypothetical protein